MTFWGEGNSTFQMVNLLESQKAIQDQLEEQKSMLKKIDTARQASHPLLFISFFNSLIATDLAVNSHVPDPLVPAELYNFSRNRIVSCEMT